MALAWPQSPPPFQSVPMSLPTNSSPSGIRAVVCVITNGKDSAIQIRAAPELHRNVHHAIDILRLETQSTPVAHLRIIKRFLELPGKPYGSEIDDERANSTPVSSKADHFHLVLLPWGCKQIKRASETKKNCSDDGVRANSSKISMIFCHRREILDDV